MAYKFITRAINEVPKQAHFGGKAAYTPAEVGAVVKSLRVPQAVSNGAEYATRGKARNAARTLQGHVKRQTGGKVVTRVAVIGDEPKVSFWLVPRS
jgi:hypothetical protein